MSEVKQEFRSIIKNLIILQFSIKNQYFFLPYKKESRFENQELKIWQIENQDFNFSLVSSNRGNCDLRSRVPKLQCCTEFGSTSVLSETQFKPFLVIEYYVNCANNSNTDNSYICLQITVLCVEVI